MDNQQRKTFKTLFIIASVLLLTLPAVITFNEILTSFVESLGFYRWIQRVVIPQEAKMITTVVRLFWIDAFPTATGVVIGNQYTIGNHVTISWNCLGWQSFILFAITLITGLQGPYTRLTKAQAIIIGTLGTYLVNILRISLIVVISQAVSRTAGTLIHDYLSALLTLAWLFIFWWFAFNFILERQGGYKETVPVRKKLIFS